MRIPTFTFLRCSMLSMAIYLALNMKAAGVEDSFDGPEIGSEWRTTGKAALDANRVHLPGGASLRLGPKASATWKLRDMDGSGTVSIWVYDDLSYPSNPKTRRGGPQWGLLQEDGRILVVGSIYAPYLSGATTFSVAEYKPPKEQPWFKVQYLGVKRARGWRQWRFGMDAEKGLSLTFDGKPVKRFDWNKTTFSGFCGVVLLGDSRENGAQTLWVDDVVVELGADMMAAPSPPPPQPSVAPAQDPPLTGPPVSLVPEVKNQHPRLFFGPDDLADLRKKALSPAMKLYWDDLLAYLPACQPPDHTSFLKNATDGQRQGLWRMPTLAMHYLVTGDAQSLNRAIGFMKKLLALQHWETGTELDAGMSSANLLVGAAICYDWLYDQLEPDFREAFRNKLIYMARAQYYGGHLNANKSTGYWQGDPANNHRWHRDAGLALAVLTACEDDPGEQWILKRTAEELAYVAKWLPEDGTSHESPTYLTFGLPHLTMAMQAADRCLGTDFLDQPFSKQVARYKLQTITPGFTTGFQFGDSSEVGGYNHPLWLYTTRHGLADVQAGLERLHSRRPKSFQFGWMAILWKDPTLPSGDISNLETTSFFPELGLAFIRDSWEPGGVAIMFKCCPFGGHSLNRYRNANGYKYVNVAHNDPDANSFMLFAGGSFLAESDRYSKHKRSANHNTILVNGKGQMVRGRKEGGRWSQPAAGKTDMTDMAFVTGWTDAGETVLIEGEAGGSYAALERFRRTLVWVKGRYILILDDIQAKARADITWLLQGPEVVAGKPNTYTLRDNETACDVAVASDSTYEGDIHKSSADHRGRQLGWQQLQLHLNQAAKRWRIVSLYDPWQRGHLQVSLDVKDDRHARVIVRSGGISDTWEWSRAPSRTTPSILKGRATLIPAEGTGAR